MWSKVHFLGGSPRRPCSTEQGVCQKSFRGDARSGVALAIFRQVISLVYALPTIETLVFVMSDVF
jgi:hypothetical protein